MKLPDYAKAIGISYTTAWRWWKANKLPHPARQTESGSIIVDYLPPVSSAKIKKNRVAIYSRVSSCENKDNLNRQSKRLTEYAVANGYQIVRNVKEIGSGLNDIAFLRKMRYAEICCTPYSIKLFMAKLVPHLLEKGYSRKQLEELLQQNDYDILLVEHKDRLARFGTNYLSVLLFRLGIKLEIVNLAENGKDELMQDLVAIVTSFAARLYGQRLGSRKTEKIIAELKDGGSECN